MVYLIVYDLNGDNCNEDTIMNAIKRLGPVNACVNKSFLVDIDRDYDSGGVFDAIKEHLKAGDRFFICPVNKDSYAGRTFRSDNVWEWLREHS